MMTELALHPDTSVRIDRYVADPPHAVLLVGPTGSGKLTVALHMASRILHRSTEELKKYPYFLHIYPADGKAISIDTIRELQHFTTLKIPGASGTSRVVIIEAAHLMTAEAQNALLKTLEEPPADTAFILTAPTADALLPTIQSRARSLRVTAPNTEVLKAYLQKDFAGQEIDKALLVSGGLPGLTYAILTAPDGHPLYEATTHARGLLQSNAYERLLLVDTLSKQKQLCLDIVFILGQMSRMALSRSNGKTAERWRNIMKAAYAAEQSLGSNAQTKLVLMNLMLEL